MSTTRRAVLGHGKYLRSRGDASRERATAAITTCGADSSVADLSMSWSRPPALPSPARNESGPVRRSPTPIEVPTSTLERLTRAVADQASGHHSRAHVIDEGLHAVLEDYAARLGLTGPFPAPPAGRRVPRGRRTRPGPLAEITVKFDPELLEQARGFLAYCRTEAVDPARVDEVSTLNDLVTVAIERVLDSASLERNEQWR